MVNSLVQRATSDMLIGPDWATNIEICDVIFRDLGEAKDVVRGIKKRLGSKNPKVQLLTLTLLETIIKNCGDIVHVHVAEKDIPHEMVKIVKKKPDYRVKEKILILIDTWQEVLGGPKARYPQYYGAYQELLDAGAVFPQKSEASAPVLTPPQRRNFEVNNQNQHNSDYQQDAPGSSAQSNASTLSLTEILNARGIVVVLTEMLNALDPGNEEGLRQDVVIDLVERCQGYKQRVADLVNSTLDESLLCQGLSLNDDLQRVLSKHEAIASQTSIQKEKPKLESAEACREGQGPLVNTRDYSKKNDMKSYTGSGTQTENQPPAKFDPKLDLLSGDDYISPAAGTSLALVPLAEQQPTTPVSQHNALVLFDAIYGSSKETDSVDNQSTNPGDQIHASVSHFQHQNFQSPQGGLHLNGSPPTPRSSHYEQSLYTHHSDPGPSWNGPVPQPEQRQPRPLSSFSGSESSESFPPPPWESQPMDNNGSVTSDQHPHSMKVTQVIFTHGQGGAYPQRPPQPIANDQIVGVYIQPIMSSQISALNGQVSAAPQAFHGGPYAAMLPCSNSGQTGQPTALYPSQMYSNHFNSHGYIHSQRTEYLQQRMYGVSFRDDNGIRNTSYQISASSGMPSSKPEDNLFGDLVDLSKFKNSKTTPATAGSR